MGGAFEVPMQRLYVGKTPDNPVKPRIGFRARARQQFTNFIHSKSPKKELMDSKPLETVDFSNLSNGKAFIPAIEKGEMVLTAGSGRVQDADVDSETRRDFSDIQNGREAVPEEFICPISKALMADPVLAASGTTYERRNIEVYLELGNRKCFKTQETLDHHVLIKNSVLRKLINQWCDSHRVPRPVVPDPESARDAVRRACRVGSPTTTELSVSDVTSSSDSSDGGSRRSRVDSSTPVPPAISSAQWIGDASFVSSSSRESDLSDSFDNRHMLLEARHHTWSSGNHPRKFTPAEDSYSSPKTDTIVKVEDEGTCASPPSPKYSHSSSVLNNRLQSGNVQQRRSGVPLPLTTTPSAFSESSLQNDGTTPTEPVAGVLDESVVSDLISKLLHKHAMEQEQGVVEIRQLTRVSAQNRLALCEPELLEVLLPLLQSRYANVQSNAIAAIMNLSLEKENKLKVARAGAIPSLIDVLKSGHHEAQEHAAGAIFSLALNDENKMAIGVLGAIPPLIHVVRTGKHAARRDAAMALYHLSFSQMNRTKLIRAGAVGILLGLARDENTDIVSRAVLILSNIAALQEGRGALVEMGAVQVLVGLLTRKDKEGTTVGADEEQSKVVNWADVGEHAAAALLQLSHHNFRFKSQALQAGALDKLQRLAEEGSPRAREKANALLTILRDSPRDLEDTGAVYRRSYNRNRGVTADEKAESAQF